MSWRVGVMAPFLVLAGAAAAAAGPMPVSPRLEAGHAVVSGRCPTFHWTAAEGASSVELVVYRVRKEGAEEVLAVTLPGSAQGWTPSVGQCFEPGARYAWSVGSGGEWSEASLFMVSYAPSAAEVEGALQVLKRYTATSEPAPRAEAGAATSVPSAIAAAPLALRADSLGAGPTGGGVTPPALYDLTVEGDVGLGGFVFKGGLSFLHNEGDRNTALGISALRDVLDGLDNTAVGEYALASVESADGNTAIGRQALATGAAGDRNTAIGIFALFANDGGSNNVGVGSSALAQNETGELNVAVGANSLNLNTSSRNTAVGALALFANTTGERNTALGYHALRNNDGNRNVAIGNRAGYNAATGTRNIFIGNDGDALDGTTQGNQVIRIGDNQDETYIAGIFGTTVTGSAVLVDSNDQLGVAASSRRFKEEIVEMGAATRALHRLRPVTFRYRQELSSSGSRSLEFGLIAEEVAKIYPELVAYDAEGRPYTVRYQLLSSMLLNEVQRHDRRIRAQAWLLGLMLAAGLTATAVRWRGRWGGNPGPSRGWQKVRFPPLRTPR